MPVTLALTYTIIAGFLNGSFALPTKNLKQWQFENIWLIYSIWGFLVLPWVIIFFLAPNVALVYQMVPAKLFFILILGGFLFGIGQVCFAEALKRIGLGLGFVINIGLSTALGFLLPLMVLHPDRMLTPFGFATLFGILFILAGLFVSYQAGKERDRLFNQHQEMMSNSQYHFGVLLAIIAGLFSAGQNFTFAATSDMQQIAINAGVNQLAASMIIWPVFLIFTFIPYFIYMWYLHLKNRSFINYQGPKTPINFIFALIMGFFWYFSLVLYSQASLLIGSLGPVVAWPLFMVLIILTSNFWGWRYKEWAFCPPTVTRKALVAVGLLIIAVIILAYSATLS